jgi:hypothetical protein
MEPLRRLNPGRHTVLATQRDNLPGSRYHVYGRTEAARILLGMISREPMLRWCKRLHDAVVAGLGKAAEATLVEASPARLTRLTTRF